MTDKTFGRLVPVDLNEGWQREAADFTPWLADDEENLGILGETLGMELALEAREMAVGGFYADIVCRDMGTNSRVVIENQLETTDHNHLGKLLTYASGLEAVTVIWITKGFRDEHRAALDWLNRNTNESVRFFGLEVQLWRIGDSPPAPRFNIVVKPNNWSREIFRSVHKMDGAELSEIGQRHKEYWKSFFQVLEKIGGPISASHRMPVARSLISHSIGRSCFNLRTGINQYNRQIRVDLYIAGADAKVFFYLLYRQKDEIENELSYPLVWDDLPAGQDTRITSYSTDDVDPEDKEDWLRQHEWLASRLISMHRVFSTRVQELDVREFSVGDDGREGESGAGSADSEN